MDYVKNQKYFKPLVLKFPLIVCAVGLVLLMAEQVLIGLLAIAAGAAIIFLQIKGKPSDEEIDAAVVSHLSDMKTRALKKLGVDEDEVSEIAPISFDGYVYTLLGEVSLLPFGVDHQVDVGVVSGVMESRIPLEVG